LTDQPMTASMQDALNRLNQDRRVRPELAPVDLMLRGAIQRGGEIVAENDRLRAQVAELTEDRDLWMASEAEAAEANRVLEARVAELERCREALDQIISDPRWVRFENFDAAWIYTIATEALHP